MDVPKIKIDPRPEAERLKAFELFLKAGEEGKRVSFRSISQKLGIHEQTIRRWARVDKWQERLAKNLGETAGIAEASSNVIKRRLRIALLTGLEELEQIVMGADKDSDKIAAVRALAEIAERTDALSASLDMKKADEAGTAEFVDDIPEAQPPVEEPASSET